MYKLVKLAKVIVNICYLIKYAVLFTFVWKSTFPMELYLLRILYIAMLPIWNITGRILLAAQEDGKCC